MTPGRAHVHRDRAPFVFTSDMAYVINGGDKPSSRFHDFVDLCCQAYNLIRKHTHLFLNLLGLVRAGGHTPVPTAMAEGSCCPHPPSPPTLSRRCCPVASPSSPTWRTSSMSTMP